MDFEKFPSKGFKPRSALSSKVVKTYQILSFYAFLGLVATGLLGYYPKMEPHSFMDLTIYQSHPKSHLLFGFSTSLALVSAQVLCIIGLLIRKHQQTKRLSLGLLSTFLSMGISVLIPYMGVLTLSGKISAGLHFQTVLTLLTGLALCLIVAGACLESVDRSHKTHLVGSQSFEPPTFVWDIHARRFALGQKLLFLGINVWWPYLVLRYGLGLKLSALAFLPVHLAGVMPFAYLKRQHKFQRTIHPDFKGPIKERKRYVRLKTSAKGPG